MAKPANSARDLSPSSAGKRIALRVKNELQSASHARD